MNPLCSVWNHKLKKKSMNFDLHLAFDNGGRLKTKLRHDDFTFPIVKLPFISSSIPASPAYGVYISQLIRYSSRACVKYSDFLHRAQLLTQKLLKQGYVAPRFEAIATNILRSSSQSGWPLRNIHISNDNGSFTFYIEVFLPLSLLKLLHDLTLYMGNTTGVL
jgi:hypothetical protein